MNKKYNHAEAFCLMTYVCNDCNVSEELWNSRDGVTPFIISCDKCKGDMEHSFKKPDECFPDYEPEDGMRIFTDLTLDKFRSIQLKRVKKVWNIPDYESITSVYDTPEEFIKTLEFEAGTPNVIHYKSDTTPLKTEINVDIDPYVIDKFMNSFNILAKGVHNNAINKGWWETDRNDGELIALMHCELSEAVEALRCNIDKSEHIPEYSGVEEELADVILRIMDFAQARNLNVAEALISKMNFNMLREYKHGGKNF